MKRFIAALILCTLLVSGSYAQDLIYLRAKAEPLQVTVVQINPAEVKYRIPSDSLYVYYLPKIKTKEIVFASGTRVKFEDINEYRVQAIKTPLAITMSIKMGYTFHTPKRLKK